MNVDVVAVSKQFPGTLALDSVSMSIRAGEIHALIGENGAGKSTLIKVIGGAITPDSGHVSIDGVHQNFATPRHALKAGIHIIHQELMMFPQLSVAENIFLGNEPQLKIVRRKQWEEKALSLLESLGHPVNPRTLVENLSVADQQMIEIARALSQEAQVLILDEPTSVIAGDEVEMLLNRCRELRDSNVAILYISHRLEEIFEISDKITVLKDGKHVVTRPTRELNQYSLTELMVGRPVKDRFPPKREFGEPDRVILEVRNLVSPPHVLDGNFELKEGEILGLGGLVGAGRSELAEAVFGARKVKSGTVKLYGNEVTGSLPIEMIKRGVGFVSEDRQSTGLLKLLDIASNISVATLEQFCKRNLIDRHKERTVAREEIERFSIAAPGPEAPVATLSGGNQQKTLLSRWSRVAKLVLILDEPTRGVDVGAKTEIYRIIYSLANAGVSILLISSEMTELIAIADRVAVMREGRITGLLERDQVSENSILRLAMGTG